jgi:prepilin-type N-terminal cleavage/methylation domain-containing protein
MSPFLLSRKAFTLIEIMIVVAVMGLLLALGIPAFVQAWHKEGMRKASSEIMEICSDARADAILNGRITSVVFHPLEGTFQMVPGEKKEGTTGEATAAPAATTPAATFKFPDDIGIEILGVNFQELQESEEARVRFFPNGTSDEFSIVLRSHRNEMRKISLEVITGLAELEVIR